jgi:aminoglycoside phosphotransferase family enzyme
LTASRLQTRADLANAEVVRLVKKLAKEHHSAALAQLASRIGSVLRYGAADGDDVFAKVKSLITDMISKLEAEANSEATEKLIATKSWLRQRQRSLSWRAPSPS